MKALFYAVSFFVLSFASLSLFSCATQAQPDPKAQPAPKTQRNVQPTSLNPVYVTNKIKVFPLPTEAIAEEIESYQIFSGTFSMKGITKEFSSPVYLQADKNGIVIMLLTDFGMEAGTIFYDGKEAKIESSFFPQNIKCEYIILDLQNAYCTADELSAHYEKAGLTFAQDTTTEKTVRTIAKGKKLIEEIEITQSEIVIKNHLRKYSYRLTVCE